MNTSNIFALASSSIIFTGGRGSSIALSAAGHAGTIRLHVWIPAEVRGKYLGVPSRASRLLLKGTFGLAEPRRSMETHNFSYLLSLFPRFSALLLRSTFPSKLFTSWKSRYNNNGASSSSLHDSHARLMRVCVCVCVPSLAIQPRAAQLVSFRVHYMWAPRRTPETHPLSVPNAGAQQRQTADVVQQRRDNSSCIFKLLRFFVQATVPLCEMCPPTRVPL